MLQESIAQLTGSLKFHVDTRPLLAFEQKLNSVIQRIQALGKQAEQVSAQLSQKLGIKTTNLEAQAKAQKSVTASLDRELKLERLVERAKRDTFATELSQQKLQFAGVKEQAFLSSEKIKNQQQMAVLSAKEYRAQQESLKAQGLSNKNAQGIEAAKAHQLRSEKLLALTQAKTQGLQAKHLQTLSATQRVELAMQHARERSQRATEKFQQSQAEATKRAQRLDVKHQQSQQRFEWASSRQQQWEANKNVPSPSGLNPLALLGGGGLAGALGPIGVALAGVATALTAIHARLDKRQAGAAEGEQWDLVMTQAGGKDPATQKRVKEGFLQMTDELGASNDLAAVEKFRTFMENQRSIGKSVEESLTTYKTQLAAYRTAGLTKDKADLADIQVSQVRSIGYADTEDVKTFAQHAPAIKQAIIDAWVKRTGYKGDNSAGAFMKAIPERGVLSADFEAGFALYVKQNEEVLEAQKKSITASEIRAENDRYLQTQNINSTAEVIASVKERIQAERELTEAMQPINETLARLDVGLMGLETWALRLVSGRNSDGTTKDANPDKVPTSYPGAAQDRRDMESMRANRLKREEEQRKSSISGSAAAYGGSEDAPQVQSVLDGLSGANSAWWQKVKADIEGQSFLPNITLPKGFNIPTPAPAPTPSVPTPSATPANNASPPAPNTTIPQDLKIEQRYEFNIVGNPDPRGMIAILEPEIRRIAEKTNADSYKGWYTKEVK